MPDIPVEIEAKLADLSEGERKRYEAMAKGTIERFAHIVELELMGDHTEALYKAYDLGVYLEAFHGNYRRQYSLYKLAQYVANMKAS